MAVQISGNDITVPRDGTFTRNVTIGGTLTYEDVTNIDSVGLITARTGIEIGARPGVAASISVDGNMIVSGISTFGGDVQVPDKIIHAGDTDTAIRFASADTITVETNGNERMRVASNGRVGINESTPLGKLHVKSSESGATVGASADDLVIESSGSTGMTILSGTTGEGAINFGDSDDNNIGKVVYMHDGNYMYFKTSDTERLRIDSEGRMGVGLTPNTSDVATNISPGLIQTDGNIDLRYSGTNNDPAGARYVNFINTDTTLVSGQPLGGLHWIGNDSENSNTINAAILVDCVGNAGASADLLFKTTDTLRIRIKSNGDLVSSSGSTSRIAFGSGDGTLYSGMGYYAGGNQDVGLSLYATTNAGVQFVEHFRMEHNGTLKGTDTSIGSLSDSRLKKDIADYSYDISKFKQFKPKSFNWINPEVHGDKSNVKGFLAQDIETVDGDWVEDSWVNKDDPDFSLISDTTTTNGAGETVGVSKMSKFGYKDAMYISVIQQLISRIETLEGS